MPAAAGRRLIVAERTLSFIEVARVLADALPAYRRKLPRFELPDWLVKLVGVFDGDVRTTVADLGKLEHADSGAAREVLGIEFRDAREAVAASARSLIAHARAQASSAARASRAQYGATMTRPPSSAATRVT